MNEVKKPRKPLMFYYGVAIVIILLFNLFAMPMLESAMVTEVDYGTFMTMTQEKNIGKVEIQYNQIIFTDKADETIYKTGVMNDPNLTERLYNAGAVFASPIAKEASPIMSFLMSWILPMVIFILLGQVLSRWMMKKMGGPNSMMFDAAKSDAKVYVKSDTGTKFDDIEGVDEA